MRSIRLSRDRFRQRTPPLAATPHHLLRRSLSSRRSLNAYTVRVVRTNTVGAVVLGYAEHVDARFARSRRPRQPVCSHCSANAGAYGILPYGIEKCVHSARCLHRIADRGASWALPPTEIMHTQCALFVQTMPPSARGVVPPGGTSSVYEAERVSVCSHCSAVGILIHRKHSPSRLHA